MLDFIEKSPTCFHAVVNIGAIVCRGFANATTIIVSQSLGNNKIEETKVYAGRMLWITFLVIRSMSDLEREKFKYLQP